MANQTMETLVFPFENKIQGISDLQTANPLHPFPFSIFP
jgi:hypothetical protein